jgi:hypothetical protein
MSFISAKKLALIALVSSFIIGLLAFATIAISSPVPFASTKYTVGLMLLILGIWAINIALVYLAEKQVRSSIPVYIVRYTVSYIICLALVYIIQPLPQAVRAMPHKIHAVQPVASIDHTRPIAVGRGQGFSPNLLLALALNSIILLIQDLALFRDKKSSIELENAELKIKNMEAANHRLKQQIHPHFLFNSLNTLKTLIKNEPEKAEDYLVNLSEFLRASLSNTMNIVALCDEIELAVNYLEMQAIRFGDALHYTINIPEEIQQTGFVPALSIQPLLENAIKHNILTKVLPLYITVTYHEDWLTVANTLQPKTTTDSGAGLGLHNLSERYKILSDNDIVIVKSHEQFSVSIKILDNASSHHRG